jgi:hypothetical protein
MTTDTTDTTATRSPTLADFPPDVVKSVRRYLQLGDLRLRAEAGDPDQGIDIDHVDRMLTAAGDEMIARVDAEIAKNGEGA